MDNPFKNKIILKPDKNANITEILNKINEIDFVEKAEYVSDSECQEKQK